MCYQKVTNTLKIFISKEYNVTAASVVPYATYVYIYCQLSAVITLRAVAIGISQFVRCVCNHFFKVVSIY